MRTFLIIGIALLAIVPLAAADNQSSPATVQVSARTVYVSTLAASNNDRLQTAIELRRLQKSMANDTDAAERVTQAQGELARDCALAAREAEAAGKTDWKHLWMDRVDDQRRALELASIALAHKDQLTAVQLCETADVITRMKKELSDSDYVAINRRVWTALGSCSDQAVALALILEHSTSCLVPAAPPPVIAVVSP